MKKSAGVGLWKRRKAEKSKNRLSRLAWKSRKHRGIPTLPQPRRRLVVNLNRTFHLLQKPDIFTCYQQESGVGPSGEGRIGTQRMVALATTVAKITNHESKNKIPFTFSRSPNGP